MKKGGVAALKEASGGLLFPSETDAPFEPFEWPSAGEGKPDKARVAGLAGLPAGTPVKVKSLAAFFADATREEAWHDEEEKQQVERFEQLVQAIKAALAHVKVFETGKVEIDVYIVGRADTGWAG